MYSKLWIKGLAIAVLALAFMFAYSPPQIAAADADNVAQAKADRTYTGFANTRAREQV
jgi:hypothetical protein